MCLIGNFIVQHTTLKPLGDRVLVKIKDAEEKTVGGIILPSTAQSKPQGGEVVAVGEGKTVGKNNVEVSVKVMGATGFYENLELFSLSFNFEFM